MSSLSPKFAAIEQADQVLRAAGLPSYSQMFGRMQYLVSQAKLFGMEEASNGAYLKGKEAVEQILCLERGGRVSAAARFQKQFRGSSPVFTCRICRRRTRDTGDNGGVELCPECNEHSMIENGINDGHYAAGSPELAQAEASILRLKEAAASKGGNRARLDLPPGSMK